MTTASRARGAVGCLAEGYVPDVRAIRSLGNADGVIAVLRDIESGAVDNALAKVAGEDRTREAMLRGAKLRDVFAEYNVP